MMAATPFRVPLTVLLLFFCVHFSFAQQTTQPSNAAQRPETSDLVFKSVVNRVILDVVVTDSLGKPVHGLTQQDFSLAENGQAQQILSFDVHGLDSTEEFPKLPPLPPNTFVNVPSAPERGPLYVLLLDLVNTAVVDQMSARQQLLKFIDDKPSGTRFAVFALADGLHLVQGFTDDKSKLSAALDPAKPKSHIPRVFMYGRNYGCNDGEMMVSVFAFISRYLDGLPGRKNLIWFSGAFPLDLFPTDDNTSVSFRDEVKETLDIMAQGQVAIYPVDASGVVVGNPDDPCGKGSEGVVAITRSRGNSSGSTQGAAGSSSGNSAQVPVGSAFSSISSSQIIQDDIAKATGGHAFYSDNGVKEVLDEAVENGANYYTLTYAPSNQTYNGALRNIHVELDKKGYQLSYRRSYFAYDPNVPALDKVTFKRVSAGLEPAPPRKVGDSLYANMQHGAPLAHQLFFRTHIHTVGAPALATVAQMENLEEQPAYFRVRKKNRPLKPLAPIQLQSYVIDYTFIAGAPKAEAPGRAIRPPVLEVAAAAFDDDSRMLNALVETSGGAGNVAAQNPQGIYRVQQQLDVPLNAISIRVALRDVSTDRIGAMEIPLPLAPEPQAQATSPALSRSPDPAMAKLN
ncbi:MAG TPA: VWA domain-containing protein [Candidatus Sulfotelmatobacter sp.]